MNKMKMNIPMFAALILLLLTMITTHMTSGLYARYTASASGSATARVARFDVGCNVADNGDGTYKLTVTNDSEVSVSYTVTVEMNEHLAVTLDGRRKTLASGENAVIFQDDGWQLKPGAEAELTMAFEVADWNDLTDPDTANVEETVNLAFKVMVTAQQVD